jgi:hypothetical protein
MSPFFCLTYFLSLGCYPKVFKHISSSNELNPYRHAQKWGHLHILPSSNQSSTDVVSRGTWPNITDVTDHMSVFLRYDGVWMACATYMTIRTHLIWGRNEVGLFSTGSWLNVLTPVSTVPWAPWAKSRKGRLFLLQLDVRKVQEPTNANRAQGTFRRAGATARVYPSPGASQLGQGRDSHTESTAHHEALGIGQAALCEHAGCVHFVRVNDCSWVVRMRQAKGKGRVLLEYVSNTQNIA